MQCVTFDGYKYYRQGGKYDSLCSTVNFWVCIIWRTVNASVRWCYWGTPLFLLLSQVWCRTINQSHQLLKSEQTPSTSTRINHWWTNFFKCDHMLMRMYVPLSAYCRCCRSSQTGRHERNGWVTVSPQVCLSCHRGGMLEELQWLWRPGAVWQPHFPDSSGQADKEAGRGACQLDPTEQRPGPT